VRYRRIDANGDICAGSGQADFVSDHGAIGQAILTRLRLLQGEWWENTQDGLPLWQKILGVYGATREQIDRLYIERILGTQGVTGIQDMSSSLSNRQYSFSCTALTPFGTVTITGGNA
jgi:hypothetical protein